MERPGFTLNGRLMLGSTGIIVSSLHGRTETRIFAKQIANGKSTHSLSEEEQQAIRAALQ